MQTFSFFFFFFIFLPPTSVSYSLGLPHYIPTNHIAKIFSPTNHKFSKQKLPNSNTKCGLRRWRPLMLWFQGTELDKGGGDCQFRDLKVREFCVRERWVFDGVQSLLRRHSSSSSKKPMRESSIWHRVVGENSKKKKYWVTISYCS